ncbi:TetR/AcrR family transcriptional regulator [Mycobacterium sp. Y57]|uniref:TetR/AcrR family transcriptional regulator n=1 Tax=Mycolicibacterium xanthum TaxID=2796469 RepID=UPI001C84A7A0|nr:TetR/AcrR family transcriptional regulator [Mycolicibacterium xanthum]MBX7433990.1 TetR/AcrR family transcriptional regulator [Mycolicibacterium xanthum]
MTVGTKAQRTRERLAQVALDLFARRGFEETSVSQIAAAAGVTPMTFYRHFATKESVLIDDPYDPLIADAVARQPPALPMLAAVARGVREAWAALPQPEEDEVRDRIRIAALTPRLRALMAQGTAVSERAIAAALRARGGDGVSSDIAAAAAVAALNAAVLAWAENGTGSLADSIARATAIMESAR